MIILCKMLSLWSFCSDAWFLSLIIAIENYINLHLRKGKKIVIENFLRTLVCLSNVATKLKRHKNQRKHDKAEARTKEGWAFVCYNLQVTHCYLVYMCISSSLSLSVAESVDNLMAETHELGGSNVVVDRATPKVIYNATCLITRVSWLIFSVHVCFLVEYIAYKLNSLSSHLSQSFSSIAFQ